MINAELESFGGYGCAPSAPNVVVPLPSRGCGWRGTSRRNVLGFPLASLRCSFQLQPLQAPSVAKASVLAHQGALPFSNNAMIMACVSGRLSALSNRYFPLNLTDTSPPPHVVNQCSTVDRFRYRQRSSLLLRAFTLAS